MTAYDEVAYPSTPVAQTHPDRLAVLATLFGMRPALVDKCRVLELGCGDGSNVIPMALALPESRFVGIDLAAAPVSRGRALVEALGLRNIDLRRHDLVDMLGTSTDPTETFDFIIAHGMYSWVPREVRDALLRVCRERLTEHGVAFVSYNAYPGCHVRDMVRNMLLYHTQGDPADSRRAERARALARLFAETLPKADNLAFLQLEMQHVAERSSGLVFHDDLAPINQPFYFYELAEHAAMHGLQYLAEADFHEMQPHDLPKPLIELLAAIELERGLLAREQCLDFLKARRFRQTLLCHADIVLDRVVSPQRVTRFAVAVQRRPAVASSDSNRGAVFELRLPGHADNARDVALAKAALMNLGAAWPRRLPFAELFERTRMDTGLVPGASTAAEQHAALAEILLETYAAGLVQLHTHVPVLSVGVSERPVASRLARLQAATEAPFITTLLHTSIRLDDATVRHLLQLLDGTRDRTALLRQLEAWAGRTRHDNGGISAAGLEDYLRALARLGLLVA
jgi:SAM-dependent methyltransferase